MWTLGLIFVIAISFVFPRTVLAIVGGVWLGGFWWILFGPLLVVGFICDGISLAHD